VIADGILTEEVRRNGLGGIDSVRMGRAIDEIDEGFKFRKKPQASDIFDDSFLPPAGQRLIN
jgi:NitT/TauT family transport system substrate-binding protein